jgi:phage-related protein
MDGLWRLFQFGSVVQEFADRAAPSLWEAMEDRLASLMELGNSARMPVSEPIADGIFALRANADNLQARLLYFFGPQRKQIIFVHALELKKTRRIPRKDVEIAERNMKLALADLQGIYGFRVDRAH